MSTLHEKQAFILRTHVGSATDDDGNEYEMSLVNSHMPAVKSKKTGRTFVLGWADVINQAVAAGVNNEPAGKL